MDRSTSSQPHAAAALDPMRRRYGPMILIGLFSITHYVITLFSLEAQGQAFELIGSQNFQLKIVLQLIATYGVFQITGRFFVLMHSKLEEWTALKSREEAWAYLQPNKINHENLERSQNFYQTVIENIPKIISGRLDMVQNYATAFGIGCIFLYKMVEDRFWVALFILPLISGLTFLASIVCEEQYENSVERVARARPILMRWLQSYFRAARDRRFNWPTTRLAPHKDLYRTQGQRLLQPVRDAYKWDFIRDVGAILLLDLPYIGIIVTCMYMAATGSFSLAQVVVWIGILNFVVEANNALKSNRQIAAEMRAIQNVVTGDLQWIQKLQDHQSETQSLPAMQQSLRFELSDGTIVELDDKPGIYHMRGSNGSGKSTLANVVIGFQEQYSRWNDLDILTLRTSLGSAIRTIEREPVLYPNYKHLHEQVLGPGAEDQDLQTHIHQRMLSVLSPDTAARWRVKLQQLQQSWTSRQELIVDTGEGTGSSLLSSGEKVCLAFMRMMSHWQPSIKVLVVDECDSFLDKDTQALFMQSLQEISRHQAIYYISHINA